MSNSGAPRKGIDAREGQRGHLLPQGRRRGTRNRCYFLRCFHRGGETIKDDRDALAKPRYEHAQASGRSVGSKVEAVGMSQARGEAASPLKLGARPGAKARLALVLIALGLMLGGCGNCNGWTNPWSRVAAPHSCQSDPASERAMILPLSE
jgi:hypothetical protein